MSNEKKSIEPCFDHFSMFDFAYVRGTVLSLSTLGRSVSVRAEAASGEAAVGPAPGLASGSAPASGLAGVTAPSAAVDGLAAARGGGASGATP